MSKSQKPKRKSRPAAQIEESATPEQKLLRAAAEITEQPAGAQVLGRFGRFEKLLPLSDVIAILTGHQNSLQRSIDALRKLAKQGN